MSGKKKKVKKRPPPSARKEASRKQVKVLVDDHTQQLAQFREDMKNKPDAIRQLAANLYIAGDGALRDIYKVDPVCRVQFSTLMRWANEGDWVRKREGFRTHVQQRVERELGTRVAKIRVRQLMEVQRMNRQFFRAIMEMNPTQIRGSAKSVEGMATAWIKMIELEGKLTESIQAQVPGTVGGVSSDEQNFGQPRLTDKEARDVARTVLLRRLDAAEGSTDDEE